MQFWFFYLDLKYLNFATFRRIYLLSVSCDFVLHFGDETQPYTMFPVNVHLDQPCF